MHGHVGTMSRAGVLPHLLDLGHPHSTNTAMTSAKIIEDIGARISDAVASSPARDLDKNIRALLSGALARLDLVPRSEFDVQAQVLLRTREKLEALTIRVAELEARAAASDPSN